MTGEPKKKPRVDKRKNIGKVAEILAKNPNKTEKEIAKEANIGGGTVNRAKQELEKTGAKDPTIAYIVGSSKNRLKRSQAIFDRWLDQIDESEKLLTRDIIVVKDISEADIKRVTVLGGAFTDEDGGYKELTEKQIAAINSLKALEL